MSHAYSVKQSEDICKTLNVLQLRKIISDVYLEHLKAIIQSVFMPGYKGKVVNIALFSKKYRTSVSHFLNNDKWNNLQFEKNLKRQIIDRIYGESRKNGEPVFCIVDNAIVLYDKSRSKTEIVHAIFSPPARSFAPRSNQINCGSRIYPTD